MTKEEVLQKVTLNLFSNDVRQLRKQYEVGWTEAVRLAVRAYIKGKLGFVRCPSCNYEFYSDWEGEEHERDHKE